VPNPQQQADKRNQRIATWSNLLGQQVNLVSCDSKPYSVYINAHASLLHWFIKTRNHTTSDDSVLGNLSVHTCVSESEQGAMNG